MDLSRIFQGKLSRILFIKAEVILIIFLLKKKLLLPIYLEPDNDEPLVKCAEIYRPIRTYCYRVMFSGVKPYDIFSHDYKTDRQMYASAYEAKKSRNSESFTIDEIAYEPKNKIMKVVPVTVFPLSDEYNINKLLKRPPRDRLELLLHSLRSSDLISAFYVDTNSSANNLKFDNKFVVPCLVLRYLLLKNYMILCFNDIEAFLWTFIWTSR